MPDVHGERPEHRDHMLAVRRWSERTRLDRQRQAWTPRAGGAGAFAVLLSLLLVLALGHAPGETRSAGAPWARATVAIGARRPSSMRVAASAPGGTLPPLPRRWPRRLGLGLIDPPGDASALSASGSFGFRYQYLSGGVNTGHGWATWSPDGAFVDRYIQESVAVGLTPVFSYYMLQQSEPGARRGSNQVADVANLTDPATMRSYFADVELFMLRAGAFRAKTVIFQVEPDLWGYIEQRALDDAAATVPVAVSASGDAELRGLPNDAAGLAQAFVRIRDRYAPNVLLAYALSDFGTGVDIAADRPSSAEVDDLAARSAMFFRSLGADFDLVFSEFSNRDAAYRRLVDGEGSTVWWDTTDYENNLSYLARFVQLSRRRVLIWQIPLGNTVMRSMNNTPYHYQDNHVQWLLGVGGRAHMRAYVDAGVIGLLFGAALPTDTCACDAARDGITNPPPIDGNTRRALSADDDGGYFRAVARLYARAPIALPR
jgi:hypothetical protein